ncbi:carbohydrate ABC transporter permease [Cucumibacter marinus]|uniref:carbohydrate ABC transporter permease n=1 Tax=Cucumibacter marinus TaxID=1121252 RepID=UPI0003F694A2|nr:carbohydrate ABC transporter permease [Cucumibacter marinus]
MSDSRYGPKELVREALLICVAIVWCAPFYFLVMVSGKSDTDVFRAPLAWPEEFMFDNFRRAWAGTNRVTLGEALINSAVVTVATVAILILVGSITAYAVTRARATSREWIYIFFVFAIITPWQLSVVPLYTSFRQMGLVGNQLGIIILFSGLLMPLAVFLYVGFLRAMPMEYEEAAEVDGAGRWRIFFRVVFPLLTPVTATVAVMTGLIVWNDFFMQLIFLTGSDVQTLPISIFGFVGEYAARWNLVFAAVCVALAPIIGFYVFAQKELIRGFSGGIKN